MTSHEDRWAKVRTEAATALTGLFERGDVRLESVLRHPHGISSRGDVHAVLKYLLKFGNADEVACGILSCGDWIQADNELSAGLDQAGASAR